MHSPHQRLTLAIVVLLTIAVGRVCAQDTPRQLFEAGKYQAAIEKTGGDAAPDALFIKGLSHLKLNQSDAAKEAFGHIGGDESWQEVSKSAVALANGDNDAALAAAQAAVGHNANLPEAQFQLGRVLEARNDSPGAADAFAKAAQANPQMAYAHYNAGMNYYKAKRVDRMAVYFENFLKLAPNAPERPAVESIMRTVRGR